MFYKEFAQNALANIEKFKENKFWASVAANRLTKDFLFSDAEPDQLFGLLFVENEKNRLACDYLMACVLLEKDLQKFINYYTLCQKAGYKVLPKNWQEALIFAYHQTHGNLNGIPPIVTTNVVNDFQQFMQTYSRNPQLAKADKTYYAYLLNLK